MAKNEACTCEDESDVDTRRKKVSFSRLMKQVATANSFLQRKLFYGMLRHEPHYVGVVAVKHSPAKTAHGAVYDEGVAVFGTRGFRIP